MQEKGIGQQWPVFYRAFAWLMEKAGDASGAETLLKQGLQRWVHAVWQPDAET